MLVGAFADRITPPRETLRLWEHWDQPPLYFFPGTHLAWRGGDALQMRWAAHLSRQLADRPQRGGPPLSRFREGAS